MGLYPKIPYVVGQETALLQSKRVADKKIYIRRRLPGNIIVVHGVNDVGTSYKAIEDGLCAGLCTRLGRAFTPATYRQPTKADQERVEPDPDAVFFKRAVVEATNSPIIPFYWGFREVSNKTLMANGQFTDRYGTRLDKDLSKGGGPFINATTTLPEMWNRGFYPLYDFVGDPIRPLVPAPGRMYMVLAAKRLAALISMIRDYDANETVTIVGHSQGCMLALLAQAMLMEQGLPPADTLILTHPPYSLNDKPGLLAGAAEINRAGGDGLMKGHYSELNGRQPMGARLQTLVNIVSGVAGKTDAARRPDFVSLNDDREHHGMVGSAWKATTDRDNRGKVYLYFCPEDMTVALGSIQGIGWEGVPDVVEGTVIKWEQDMVRHPETGKRKPMGPFRPVSYIATRYPLHDLGPRFYQRVFSAKWRPDPRNGKIGPVLVGLPTHDFVLRMKGEDDRAHVEDSNRSYRHQHDEAQWPINTKGSFQQQRLGIRTINGEALSTPVLADLIGTGQIEPQNIPNTSSHAHLSAQDRGPCEEIDPISAATAVSNVSLRANIVEERPDPSGTPKNWDQDEPEELFSELKEMTRQYNKEKNLVLPGAQRTVVNAFRFKGGKIIALIQESENDARLYWQHEVSAKSFHGGIVDSARNHEYVTAYDVAIGGGQASSDPNFYAYLCAVADWRLKDPSNREVRRPGILLWATFQEKFGIYLRKEPDWRADLIKGNMNYYSKGDLPSRLPILSGPLSSIVISELKKGMNTSQKGKP
jgi:pimeloyl-ACP methyl ester carboxylesterase